MSISVRCEECDRTYQVRDEMAGRKGKCPKGHKIFVPGGQVSSAAPVDENEFAFDTGSRFDERRDPPPSKRSAKPAERKMPEKAKAATAARSPEDDFAFPSTESIAEREEEPAPTSGRYRASPRSSSSHQAVAAKKTMMPLVIGGVLAVVGIGGGVAMFFIQRAEVVPLREKAEAATKRADEAETKMKTAEAVAVAAEANATKAKEAAAVADTALKDARSKTSAAEKQVASLKTQIKELEAAKPTMPEPVAPAVGKNDPPDPKGGVPKGDGGPLGGKNWTAPPTIQFGMLNHKAGDRISLLPKEDAVLKAEGGMLKIKFRFQLRKGQEMPADMVATVFITRGIFTNGITMNGFKLTGDNGDSEISVNVKDFPGMAKVSFFLADSTNPGSEKLKLYSTILTIEADLGKEKE